MTSTFEQAKEWGREIILRECARDLADAHGMSVEAALELVRKVAEPPPPPTTVEEFIRASIMEGLVNLSVWGQHPPPEHGPELLGIGSSYVVRGRGWGRGMRGPTPIATLVDEALHATQVLDVEAEIDAIRHDPLWSVDRSRVTGASRAG